MKAAIFSNHSPRVGFGVDRKMDVSRSQVMVVAASRNQLFSIKQGFTSLAATSEAFVVLAGVISCAREQVQFDIVHLRLFHTSYTLPSCRFYLAFRKPRS